MKPFLFVCVLLFLTACALVPVLDDSGNTIPVLDAAGEPVVDEAGEPVVEMETVVDPEAVGEAVTALMPWLPQPAGAIGTLLIPFAVAALKKKKA